jgi:hypothetical protein
MSILFSDQSVRHLAWLGMVLGLGACGDVPQLGGAQEGLSPAAWDLNTLCDPNQSGLHVTEIMADPKGPDQGHEWFELFNASSQTLCLERAELKIGPPWAPRSHTLRNIGCMPPQSLWVLGDGQAPRDADPAVPVHYRYGNLKMPNDKGALAVVCQGQVLAALEYGPGAHVPRPQEGRALARVPMTGPGVWCTVRGLSDGAGNIGSPGANNPGCSVCMDAAGVLRSPRPVAPDALKIVQVLADPLGPSNDRAWVDIATGSEAVDLVDLALEAHAPQRQGRRWQGPEGYCATVEPWTTLRMPVCRQRPNLAEPWVWQGPSTLYHGAMTLRLEATHHRVHEVAVPKSVHHAPVCLAVDPLCSPVP